MLVAEVTILKDAEFGFQRQERKSNLFVRYQIKIDTVKYCHYFPKWLAELWKNRIPESTTCLDLLVEKKKDSPNNT